MKTIEIYHTEEDTDIIDRTYKCKNGQEKNLLYRAKLTSEIMTRDYNHEYKARIKSEE